MNFRGMGYRAEQALNSISKAYQQGPNESGSWPTARELEPGFSSIDQLCREPGDCWAAEDALLGSGSDRNDTIPSPPPELESAPWHDERPHFWQDEG